MKEIAIDDCYDQHHKYHLPIITYWCKAFRFRVEFLNWSVHDLCFSLLIKKEYLIYAKLMFLLLR